MIFHVWNFLLGARLLSLQTRNGVSVCELLRPFPLQRLNLCKSAYSILVLDQIQFFISLKIMWIEGFYEMVALPEWLGNLSSLQKLYIVDCNRLLHLPTEEAMRHLTQLKTLEIYDCPNLEDNERSKIDHIPFVDIQDSGRPDCSDFEDED